MRSTIPVKNHHHHHHQPPPQAISIKVKRGDTVLSIYRKIEQEDFLAHIITSSIWLLLLVVYMFLVIFSSYNITFFSPSMKCIKKGKSFLQLIRSSMFLIFEKLPSSYNQENMVAIIITTTLNSFSTGDRIYPSFHRTCLKTSLDISNHQKWPRVLEREEERST